MFAFGTEKEGVCALSVYICNLSDHVHTMYVPLCFYYFILYRVLYATIFVLDISDYTKLIGYEYFGHAELVPV